MLPKLRFFRGLLAKFVGSVRASRRLGTETYTTDGFDSAGTGAGAASPQRAISSLGSTVKI